jgi:hypothetical protein
VPKRHARRYLERFDSIWSLQSFLLSEADRKDTAIVTNDELEKAVRQVIITINRELSRHFEGTPLSAFGPAAEGLSAEADEADWSSRVADLINT